MKPIRTLKRLIKTPAPELAARLRYFYKQKVRRYPLHIILQTVVGCNLQCRHCYINNFGTEIPDGVRTILSFAEAAAIIDRIKPAVQAAEFFQFTTFEPFLQPELFRLMDRLLAINPRLKFPLISNGMLIDNALIARLEQYPVPSIGISLDGMNKATMESFKTGADFDRVVGAIRALAASRLGPVLSTVFVLHKNNCRELPAYVDFVNSLGVKTVYLTNLLSFTPQFKDWYLYTPHGNAEVEKIFQDTIRRVRKNGQTIWLPSMSPSTQGCSQCWDLFINNRGDVFPCDLLSVSTPFELFGETKKISPVSYGNIFENDALQIYRSKALSQFRARHKQGKNPPSICSHCIDAYSMMCSNLKRYA